MIQITATEFKKNFGKYLKMINKENVVITKNGVDVAVISAPEKKPSIVDEILGSVPFVEVDLKKERNERFGRALAGGKYESDN